MASRAADTSFVRSSKTEKWESFKTVEILHNCIAFRTGPRRCRRLIGCMHLGGSALRAVWLSVSIGSVVTSGFAQQGSIGLQIVLDVETRTLVFLFERDHLLEEFDAQQRRLA